MLQTFAPQAANSDLGPLHRRALLLAKITVMYDILEGVVSVFFGMTDETFSLFGFGIDSFVEVVSRIGGLDALGAAAIGVFAFSKGREAFQKARGKACNCCCQGG
jgi:hypothetical protein